MPTKLTMIVMMAGLWLVGTAVPVRAHHAFAAEFDANKPVHFEGTVTKMEWTNPHVWLHMDVKKADGSVENWRSEERRVGKECRSRWAEDQEKKKETSGR